MVKLGRPDSHVAPYFPFFCKDGRTLFILESKYQCKGTGFFTNVMRFLALTPDHHCCIADESDRLYFFSKAHCDEESAMDMLNIMVKTGKIDADLWNNKRVLASEDLLNSLKRCYEKRENPIISMDQIRTHYHGKPLTGPGNLDSPPGNTQSKVKESKVKNTIGSLTLPDWIPEKTWEEYLEMRKRIKKPLLEKSFPRVWKELDRLRGMGNSSEAVLNQSIINTWQGVFEIKKPFNTGGKDVGIRTNRSDPRDTRLQSRADAEAAAITARWEASQALPSDPPGRNAGNDDAPDFKNGRCTGNDGLSCYPSAAGGTPKLGNVP